MYLKSNFINFLDNLLKELEDEVDKRILKLREENKDLMKKIRNQEEELGAHKEEIGTIKRAMEETERHRRNNMAAREQAGEQIRGKGQEIKGQGKRLGV